LYVGVLSGAAWQAFKNYFSDRAEPYSAGQHSSGIDGHECQVCSD